MKVGVSATGSDLGARVDDRFGRCAWFLIVDSDSLQFAALQNRLISGQVGPKAYEVLKALNIGIFLVSAGITVKDALGRFKKGELQRMEMRVF